jgi:hypothetical protein
MDMEHRSSAARHTDASRQRGPSRNTVFLCGVAVAVTVTMPGCKQPARSQERNVDPVTASRRQAQALEPASIPTKPRVRSRPMPPTRAPPSLTLLGTWQTLEGTGFDIVLAGTDAGEVANVEIAGDQCAYQSQKSTQTMRIFRCVGPWLGSSAEETFEYAKISYNTGAPATNSGPFYFRNQTSWRQYNGEYYMQSLWNYLINASASQGPTINLEPRALPGYTGDPTIADQAAGFNAVRLWGRDGPIICNTAGYFEYKCPVVPEGVYSFDILFEQGTRYIAGNTFIIKVVYGSLDTPAPQIGNNPGSNNPPVTAPQCDPFVTKGC